MNSGPDATIFPFAAFDKAGGTETASEAQDGGRPASARLPTREIAKLPVIRTHFSRRLARTHDARTLYAVDANSGGRGSAIIRKMSANRFRGMATSPKWKMA